jgi:hypothetical protein
MRKTLGVSLLVLLLTGSANAGIMPNDASTPPPPPSQPATADPEPTDAEQAGEMPSDVLTQTALDLLALLPSLL